MLDAMDRARTLHLAAECESGAAKLNADAAATQNAELKTRKRAAAADLWQYAEYLRAGVDNGCVQRITLPQAAIVAQAAATGAVLPDGVRRPAYERRIVEDMLRSGVLIRVTENGQPPYIALAGYAPRT